MLVVLCGVLCVTGSLVFVVGCGFDFSFCGLGCCLLVTCLVCMLGCVCRFGCVIRMLVLISVCLITGWACVVVCTLLLFWE